LNLFIVSAVSGCLVVIFGAFGVHGLKDILDLDGKSIYEKAVLYQMFHTLVMLILGVMENIIPEIKLQMVGWAFLMGMMLFSGSLYILAVTDIKWLGMITPIGGMLFIIGWVLLLFKMF